ncbi:substrate-binding domain-containing protein [Deferrisoma palaeochoriense]
MRFQGTSVHRHRSAVAGPAARAVAARSRGRVPGVQVPRPAGAAARLLIPLLLFLAACSGGDEPFVDLSARPAAEAPAEEPAREPALRIALGSMITPKEGFRYYRELAEYLGGKLGRPVDLVDRGTYAETNELLKTGQVDAAFVCGRPYVEAHDAFGVEILAVPVVDGKTVYHSYILVPRASPANTLADLRGKRFAFTDPLSNSGCLVPTYELAQRGETPETFFGEVVYTHAHDASIRAVARGLVDGAAVDSLIWHYLARREPDVAARCRVIWRSSPYGIPPVVVRRGAGPELVRRVRDALLHAHEDPEGRRILSGMGVDRFVPGDDAAYDGIRAMRAWLEAREGRP